MIQSDPLLVCHCDLRRTVAQAAKAEAARLLALLAVFRLDVAPEAMEPVEEAILGLAADRVRYS